MALNSQITENGQTGKWFCRISFTQALLLISAAALVLRLICAWEMGRMSGGANNMFAPPPSSDLATYMKLAAGIAQGELPQEFYYQPFYYAVFLVPLYWLFGAGNGVIHAVIVVQALLSSGTVMLAGLCGREIFDRRAGVITAVMCAVSSPLILYVPFHQNETLQTFNIVLLFFLLLKTLQTHSLKMYALSGLVCGIAIATRGNIYLLLPAAAGCLYFSAYKKRLNWQQMILRTLIFALLLAAVQLPFVFHNTRSRGKFTGASTAANAVLALGNSKEAAAGGREAGPPGAMYYPESYRRMMARTVSMNPKSVPGQMWEWFCEEPLAFAELQLRKLLLFWDGIEIPNNVSLYFEGAHSLVLRWLLIGRSTVLLTLSLAGIFWFFPALLRRGKVELFLLYGFVVLFYGAVTVFYMLSRFRAPILPVIFIFGGAVPGEWFDLLKNAAGEKKRLLRMQMLLILLSAFFFVFGAYNCYRLYLESSVHEFIRPDGVMVDSNGEDIQFFDHGPRPFGGWTEMELKPGDVLVKKFANCHTEYGTLYLALANLDRVQLSLKINGRNITLELPETSAGKHPWKNYGVPVLLSEGCAVIEVVSFTGKCAALCDQQRNYRRSSYNGDLPGGEFVMRFGRPR